MAEPQTPWQRIGLTRGKAVLIGVLAVALVGVVYAQYGGAPAEEVPSLADESSRPRRALRVQSQDDAAATAAEQAPKTESASAAALAFDPGRWESPDLSTVVAYDPFALPAAFPRPPQSELDARLVPGGTDADLASADANALAAAIEQLRMELEALQQRGVQVIVRGRDQYVAVIGDRKLHVGDEINGFTVTAIGADGVRVERKVDQ